MECAACNLAKEGEMLYEDDKVFAFLDISPVNKGHALVIPKKHYANLEEIPEADLVATIKTVKKVGKAIKKGVDKVKEVVKKKKSDNSISDSERADRRKKSGNYNSDGSVKDASERNA